MAKAFGLTIVAWSPLKGGVLSGKYHAASTGSEKPEGEGSAANRYESDMMKAYLPAKERQDRVVTALQEVSKQTGCPSAQVALAWLSTRTVPVIPIIGARRIAQLEDNLASLTLHLTPEQVAALDAASSIEMGFPHDFYALEMVSQFTHGGMRDRILA